MANNLQLDPMYIDTAGSGISTGRLVNLFVSVEWVNPSAINDKAKMTDALGAIVCDFTCVTPHMNLAKYFSDTGQTYQGPFTLNLGSGYLLIDRK
jgi:hypothetical protein